MSYILTMPNTITHSDKVIPAGDNSRVVVFGDTRQVFQEHAMKKIDISTPKYPDTFALVDDEDYEKLNSFNWHADKGRHTLYAERTKWNGKSYVKFKMHRDIMQSPQGADVDHRDGNGLNNQRHNLRPCTRSQNQHNRRLQGGSSVYKGVHWNKDAKKWHGTIQCNKEKFHLGLFTDEIEAAKAYDNKAKELFGEFAYLNFPEE
jgi:hypothetical protein